MREFFQTFEWWNLVPDFNDQKKFKPGKTPDDTLALYTCATIGSDLYVVYFYGQNTATGVVCGMDDGATYEAKWFNPRTNEYAPIGEVTSTDGQWEVPEKSEALDFVLFLQKKA